MLAHNNVVPDSKPTNQMSKSFHPSTSRTEFLDFRGSVFKTVLDSIMPCIHLMPFLHWLHNLIFKVLPECFFQACIKKTTLLLALPHPFVMNIKSLYFRKVG